MHFLSDLSPISALAPRLYYKSSLIFTHAFLYFHTTPLPRPVQPLRAPVTSANNRPAGVLQCHSSGLRT